MFRVKPNNPPRWTTQRLDIPDRKSAGKGVSSFRPASQPSSVGGCPLYAIDVLKGQRCTRPLGDRIVNANNGEFLAKRSCGGVVATRRTEPIYLQKAPCAVIGKHRRGVRVQGFLAHRKTHPSLGPPQDPRHRPTAESYGVAVSY